ncbi:MAG: BatA domain-containing protein, partial [Pseudomonadota bacterium]
MMTIGPLAFTAPWLLLGLGALPVLWLLLRAVPPAPMRRRFPGVALLLGLTDDETQTDRTPWWLLMLRTAAVAAVIVGFAGPVLNPQAERAGDGPLVIAVDGTWADAWSWNARLDRIDALLSEAGQGGRPVALVTLTDPPAGALEFRSADVLRLRLAGVRPRPWQPA